MECNFNRNAEFHRCSIQDNNMADIRSNKKSFIHARRYFKEYSDYTGIHGLTYIAENRSLCEKIIWTIIFCLSLFTCITIVYELFKKWQASPIVVNFASEEYNIFDISFPAVTICPETKVYSDYFNYSYTLRTFNHKEYNISEEETKKLQYMSLLCSNANLEYLNLTVKQADTIGEEFYVFLKTGAPPFLTNCSFLGQNFSCSRIFQPIITDEGLCFTFNMLSKKDMFTNEVENIEEPPRDYHDYRNKYWSTDYGYSSDSGIETYPRRALLSGSTNALEVRLAVNNTDIDYGCTYYQGYKVVLHTPHRFPTVNSHYFRIPLKKSVSAAIIPSVFTTTEEVMAYSAKKRKCYLQSDNHHLKYFSNYSQLNCRMECLMNMTLDTCGCVMYFMPRKMAMPMCGTGKLDCVHNVSALYNFLAHQEFMFLKGQLDEQARKKEYERYKNHFKHRHYMNKLSSKHMCNCPSLCNAVDYNVEITESDYDWPRKMAALGVDVVTEDNEGMSSSQLQVYFKSNIFIPQQRTELYGIFDFLANIGGLLGLFIGFSLLSMVELIYFLSLRIICNMKLYKAWYGKPECKNKNPMLVDKTTIIK